MNEIVEVCINELRKRSDDQAIQAIGDDDQHNVLFGVELRQALEDEQKEGKYPDPMEQDRVQFKEASALPGQKRPHTSDRVIRIYDVRINGHKQEQAGRYNAGDQNKPIPMAALIKARKRMKIQKQTAKMARDPVAAVAVCNSVYLLRGFQQKQQSCAELERQQFGFFVFVVQFAADHPGKRRVNDKLGDQRIYVQWRPKHGFILLIRCFTKMKRTCSVTL